MNFFTIKSKHSLQRLTALLEEYELYNMKDEDSFLIFGYKTLPPHAKETYRIMRNLFELSRKRRQKGQKDQIEISLEYLSVVFNTTKEAQSARIQQLVKHGLVRVKKTSSNFNSYHILHPIPDSTFVNTVVNLIRRKRLGIASYNYLNASSITEKTKYLQEIKRLQAKGAKHFTASSITGM